MVIELVAAQHHDTRSTEAFVAALRSLDDPASQRVLERLEAIGYPIVRMRPSSQPYRLFAQIGGERPEPRPLRICMGGSSSRCSAASPAAWRSDRSPSIAAAIKTSSPTLPWRRTPRLRAPSCCSRSGRTRLRRSHRKASAARYGGCAKRWPRPRDAKPAGTSRRQLDRARPRLGLDRCALVPGICRMRGNRVRER